jgi:hypothetical protein
VSLLLRFPEAAETGTKTAREWRINVKKAIVVSMVVALLLQAACGTQATPTQEPAPVPTSTAVLASSAEQILGTWLGRGADGLYHLFKEDGICHVAVSQENLLTSPTP